MRRGRRREAGRERGAGGVCVCVFEREGNRERGVWVCMGAKGAERLTRPHTQEGGGLAMVVTQKMVFQYVASVLARAQFAVEVLCHEL